MNAYTISKLAQDAGVSTSIVHDYEVRGMFQPCQYSDGGYRIYDHKALERLQFVLAGKEVGITLDELASLCKALDQADKNLIDKNHNHVSERLNHIAQCLARFRRMLKQQ